MNHVCFLSSSFTREDPRIFQREALSLVEAGYKVTCLVSDNCPDEVITGISVISTGYRPTGRLHRMFFTKGLIFKKAMFANADVYQVSEPELISVGLKLKRYGKKVVFDMREDYVQLIKEKDYIPYLFRPIISKLLQFFMQYSLPRFDAVFAVDPHLVNIVKQTFKIKYVHLVTNYPVTGNPVKFSLEEYKQRGNLLFYSGSVYRISRQEVLFKALDKVKNLNYLIAGKIDDSYRTELEMLSYWPNVLFIDGSDYKRVKSLHFTATIGNSLRDFSNSGFPNGSLGVIKIYEYMEAGIPVICSNVALWKEMIQKYNCGICVEPNNANEIEGALRFLTENKEEAYQMGQNGIKAVFEEYNWATQAKTYLNVIKCLLN